LVDLIHQGSGVNAKESVSLGGAPLRRSFHKSAAICDAFKRFEMPNTASARRTSNGSGVCARDGMVAPSVSKRKEIVGLPARIVRVVNMFPKAILNRGLDVKLEEAAVVFAISNRSEVNAGG
jgi:hypothetical protein